MPHGKPWGIDMVLYLLFKAISTGAMLVAALLWWLGFESALATLAAPAISIVFIALTAIVLIVGSLGSALYYMLRDRDDPKKMARALAIRVGLSVGLFVLLMAGWMLGLWQPHGL